MAPHLETKKHGKKMHKNLNHFVDQMRLNLFQVQNTLLSKSTTDNLQKTIELSKANSNMLYPTSMPK